MSECPFFIEPYEGDSDMYVSTLRCSKTKSAIAPLTAQESFDMKMMMQAFSFVDKNNPFVPKSDLGTLTETNRLLNLECEELKKDIEAMKKAIDDLSERVVFPALALAKLDYPNSSKAAMDMTDWRSFMSKIKYDK